MGYLENGRNVVSRFGELTRKRVNSTHVRENLIKRDVPRVVPPPSFAHATVFHPC